MKSRFVQRGAVLSLLVAASFASAGVLAQHKCDNPTMEIDKRACAKAAEGPDALRNFVTRTRMIWYLDMQDYVRQQEPSATHRVGSAYASRRDSGLALLTIQVNPDRQ